MSTPGYLDVVSSITTPTGGTLALDEAGSYKFEGSALSNRQVTHRKQDVSNPYTSGTYTVHSTRENVTEQVSVYVYGTSSTDLRDKLKALTDCFHQTKYTMTVQVGGFAETWTCFPADYVIEASRELQHARMALVKASVPRLPTASLL